MQNEWSDTLSRHVNLHERVLKLAERRIRSVEKAADHIDKVLDSGNHPEMLFAYLTNIRIAIDLEELEAISRILSRCSRDIRLLTGSKYNDLNEIAAFLYSKGYRIAPRKELVGSEVNENKGLSEDQISGIRKALSIELLK